MSFSSAIAHAGIRVVDLSWGFWGFIGSRGASPLKFQAFQYAFLSAFLEYSAARTPGTQSHRARFEEPVHRQRLALGVQTNISVHPIVDRYRVVSPCIHARQCIGDDVFDTLDVLNGISESGEVFIPTNLSKRHGSLSIEELQCPVIGDDDNFAAQQLIFPAQEALQYGECLLYVIVILRAGPMSYRFHLICVHM